MLDTYVDIRNTNIILSHFQISFQITSNSCELFSFYREIKVTFHSLIAAILNRSNSNLAGKIVQKTLD